MKREIEMTCLICHNQDEKGIEIFSKFICRHCEKEIIHMESTSNQYRMILHELKKISIYT
ncbi:sigma-F transcribed protein CsfB [Priestia megaterium]|nr:sigma-F transcribed protein CsfB [Priestia megaterium]